MLYEGTKNLVLETNNCFKYVVCHYFVELYSLLELESVRL